ncbi:MAG: hypothetical protein Q9214_000325 [Letrouitia sp. 1 TL-2023]
MSNLSSTFFTGPSDWHTKIFGSSATPVRASDYYANYDFIAVLGLAQRLHVRFLSIEPQKAMGRIGEGGQAGINQSLVNLQISFAFKLFNQHRQQEQHSLQECAQEMVVLSHPMILKHEYIVRLEGICWDIVTEEEDRAWPVLVFQKSHLGDLCSFAKLEKFKKLSVEERLDLCVNVGIAIRDMHNNGKMPPY